MAEPMGHAHVINPAAYDELERSAVKTLTIYLDSDGGDPTKHDKAKIAQGALASVQSHKKTELSGRALSFNMARSLTNDPEQLAQYIRVTQPDSPILEALPRGDSH